MIEKLRHITNPLTIIAIFAGLAEVAGTIAIFSLPQNLQESFIWFVMGFPISLVSLFFLTLNFNPRVLYAPSDYRDEKNFMDAVILSGAPKVESVEITNENVDSKIQNGVIINSLTPNGEGEIPKYHFKNKTKFLSIIFNRLEVMIKSKEISRFKLSTHGKDYYLLSFEFDKEKIKEKVPYGADYIVKISWDMAERTKFEVIGRNIEGSDPDEVAQILLNSIESMWEKAKI